MRLANPKALEEWRARLEEAAAACAHLPKIDGRPTPQGRQ